MITRPEISAIISTESKELSVVDEVPEGDPVDIDSEIGPVELSTPQPAIKKAAAKELAILASNSVFKIHLLQFKKNHPASGL